MSSPSITLGPPNRLLYPPQNITHATVKLWSNNSYTTRVTATPMYYRLHSCHNTTLVPYMLPLY